MIPIATQNPSAIDRSHHLAKGLRFFGLPGLSSRTGYTLRDLSGRHNHGTLINGPAWMGSTRGGFGSLKFDGTDDYVDLGLPILTVPFTVSLWVEIVATGTNITYWSMGTGNNIMRLAKNTGDEVFLQHYDGTASDVIANIPATAPGWHYLTGVFASNSSRTLYIDGINRGTNTDTRSGITATACYLAQATWGLGNQNAPNYIEDIRIWGRALSDTEEKEAYYSSRRKYPAILNHRHPVYQRSDQPAGFPFIQYYAGSGVSL